MGLAGRQRDAREKMVPVVIARNGHVPWGARAGEISGDREKSSVRKNLYDHALRVISLQYYAFWEPLVT